MQFTKLLLFIIIIFIEILFTGSHEQYYISMKFANAYKFTIHKNITVNYYNFYWNIVYWVTRTVLYIYWFTNVYLRWSCRTFIFRVQKMSCYVYQRYYIRTSHHTLYSIHTHTHTHSCPSNSFIISIIHLFLLHQFIYILYTSNSFTIQYFSNTSMIH